MPVRPSRNMATMMGATSMMQCDESCGGGKGVRSVTGWVEWDERNGWSTKRKTNLKGPAAWACLSYLVDAHLDGEERGQRGHVGDERLLRLVDDGAEAAMV